MKPSLRFLRHGGISRSDVVIKTMVTWRGEPPPVGRPPIPVKGRDGREYAPCSSASSAMSSGRLFLDRGARQQCPSPLHRHAHPKTVPGSGTMDLQRPANGVLTVCLSFRGKRSQSRPGSCGRFLLFSSRSVTTDGSNFAIDI